MRTMRLGVTLLVACAATATHAAEKVAREKWMNRMETVLPTVFCKAEAYFRQCFDVSPVECEETAASSTRVCLKKLKARIPAVLVLPEDGVKWGTDVGTCAGESYEIALLQKKRKTVKCSTPDAWR